MLKVQINQQRNDCFFFVGFNEGLKVKIKPASPPASLCLLLGFGPIETLQEFKGK